MMVALAIYRGSKSDFAGSIPKRKVIERHECFDRRRNKPAVDLGQEASVDSAGFCATLSCTHGRKNNI